MIRCMTKRDSRQAPVDPPSWKSRVEQSLPEPLPQALAALEAAAATAPREPALAQLGQEAFGLQGEALVAWCARAWWGRAASEAVYRRLIDGRIAEVAALLQPWQADTLLECVEARRGLLICGSHLGARRVVRWACTRSFPDLTILAAGTPRAGAAGVIDARDRQSRSQFVGRAIRDLRHGGMILAAPDGRQGNASVDLRFLGRPVTMRLGMARILALSGAASVAMAATWEGHRLQLRSAVLPAAPPIRRAAPTWELHWCQQYVQWLEQLCAADAANLRLMGGFWTRDGSGVLPAPRRRRKGT